jgi:hypothetical protein
MNIRQAINYTVLRFAPYPETEEFANVGVIVAMPGKGYFDYRMVTSEKRARRFFPELPTGLYKAARWAIEQELERIKGCWITTQRAEGLGLLDELARPKEGVMRLGGVRTVLADDPAALLERLYLRYVERDFITHNYQLELEGRVRLLLRERAPQYRRDVRIGNDDYGLTFPFVWTDAADQPLRALKPLTFMHGDPMDTYDLAGKWVMRVRRLFDKAHYQGKFMFALEQPAKGMPMANVAEDVAGELKEAGALIAAANDDRALLAFANG